jgi:hypothetical protein
VEAYLERALAVARKQQAKSWELRAAMSMEGFDTRKEAKTLLDALSPPPDAPLTSKDAT